MLHTWLVLHTAKFLYTVQACAHFYLFIYLILYLFFIMNEEINNIKIYTFKQTNLIATHQTKYKIETRLLFEQYI